MQREENERVGARRVIRGCEKNERIVKWPTSMDYVCGAINWLQYGKTRLSCVWSEEKGGFVPLVKGHSSASKKSNASSFEENSKFRGNSIRFLCELP